MTKKRAEWFFSCQAFVRVFFSKMKVICFVFAACLCFAVAKACLRQQWRSHTILCCTNGTALMQGNKKVWVPERPLICAPMKEPEEQAKDALLKVLGICLFFISCCLQCLWIKMCRLICQRCFRKYCARQVENEQPKADANEDKVIPELRARRYSV